MLQIALDNLQMVLPNTSVAGRDAMRRDMQALQQDYDALSGRLLEARSSQEGLLAQWTVYDDSVGQLVRWLQDLENQMAAESQLQNTMQEKKLQLERVKVCLKNSPHPMPQYNRNNKTKNNLFFLKSSLQ